MKKEILIKGYILVILSAILFGCMPLITKYIYAEGISRETAVLLRNSLALPVLALLTWRQDRSFAIPVKALPAIGLLALVGYCITTLLLYGSYQHIASGTATVFHFVYPVMVVLVEVVFFRKKVHPGTVLAVLLCVGGVCLFYNPNEPLNWTGCALALTSGVTYAVYVVLLAAFRYKQVSGFKLTFYISASCAVLMLAICLATNSLTLPTTLSGWLLCVLLSQYDACLLGVNMASLLERARKAQM